MRQPPLTDKNAVKLGKYQPFFPPKNGNVSKGVRPVVLNHGFQIMSATVLPAGMNGMTWVL